MMIHAYQEIYLPRVQTVLGDAFDYAVNSCKVAGKDFVKMFDMSSVSKKIENGEPAYISGKSGIEIAVEIIDETTEYVVDIEPKNSFGRSKEYWIGWAICYYQWYSCRKYREILNAIAYEELEDMYNTLHEADISKFVDIVDSRMRIYYKETNLKRIRNLYGISQAELAKRSGVSLRSIQMYEQRNKNINKASADTLYKISKILGCSMDELLEHM